MNEHEAMPAFRRYKLAPLPKDVEIAPTWSAFKAGYEAAKGAEQPDELCPFCGQDMAVKNGRLLCRDNWDNNGCKMNVALPKREAIIGELVEMNFEPEPPEITFQVPRDSRWFAGKYRITQIEGGK